MKARKKPIEITFLTYEQARYERVAYNDMSWQNQERGNGTYIEKYHLEKDHIIIETLEGTMKMTDKDVLIIGVQGEIYPCKIDIFNKTYDVLREQAYAKI